MLTLAIPLHHVLTRPIMHHLEHSYAIPRHSPGFFFVARVGDGVNAYDGLSLYFLSIFSLFR